MLLRADVIRGESEGEKKTGAIEFCVPFPLVS